MIEASILFVDDDPNVISGLRRMLYPMRNQWKMSFAGSGAEAIKILSEGNFDVIVSDMRMPEINGAQLLAKVKNSHPDLARVILSGHSERELALQTVNVAHQFLNKPCSLEELTTVIRKTITLRRLLSRKEICELANGIVRMPSMPQSYVAITRELNSDSPAVEKVAKIVESDPSMTITVLRLVNSGFFGMADRINSVSEAIGLLGLELLRTLALVTGIFSKYESNRRFSIEQFSLRAIRVASLARQMAMTGKFEKKTVDQVFLSGMLCDIGLLMLNTTTEDNYDIVRALAEEIGERITVVEKRILGATHAELGAYLIGLWGFDDAIVEAIAYHHHPENAPPSIHLQPLALVHVADALIPPNSCNPQPAIINPDFLSSINVLDHLSEWKSMTESLTVTANDAKGIMG